MAINIKECIRPLSYVKDNATDMVRFVNEKKEPLIITQNGESSAVLVDVESYQAMQDAFNILKLIRLSDRDIRSGRAKPASEVFKDLRYYS